MPAPVLLATSSVASADAILAVANTVLENVGVLVFGDACNDGSASGATDAAATAMPLTRSAFAYPDTTHVIEYSESTQQLDDGSPSTIGVNGTYIGAVRSQADPDLCLPLPHGHGTMSWENGITYSGSWSHGLFHGHGAKLYSEGGGYVGCWRFGKREGRGVSHFDGKWGNQQWKGTFRNDKANGVGIMTPEGGGAPFAFEFVDGMPTSP